MYWDVSVQVQLVDFFGMKNINRITLINFEITSMNNMHKFVFLNKKSEITLMIFSVLRRYREKN